MSNAVKTWQPSTHKQSTDDLGLCRIRFYVEPVFERKQIRLIEVDNG